jgi:hypothetical protein
VAHFKKTSFKRWRVRAKATFAALRWRFSHKIRKIWRNWFDRFRVKLVFYSFLLVFFYWLTLRLPWKTTWDSAFPANKPTTFHFVNILTLLGLGLTVFGFYYTFTQFKTEYERIKGYAKFYKCIEQLFEEIKSKKAHQFLFYGSTILPGNISYDGEDQIRKYGGELLKLFKRAADGEGKYAHVKEVSLILPTEKDLRINYEFFYKRHVKAFSRFQRADDQWRKFINDKFKDAQHLKLELKESDCSSRFVFTPRDERAQILKRAYFFSNGIRVIYAMPLHFVDTIEVGEDAERVFPHIVGFTTTDYELVQAYRQHFDELSGYKQQQMLGKMYSKHLISPENVRKLLQHMPQSVTVDKLAEYDQDHFGNKEATDVCIEKLGINENSNVLDMGT